MVRYTNFLERYLSEGSHPRLNKRPDRALVVTDAERAEIRLDPWRPWTYVGERVLVADGAEWVEADPQPQMDGTCSRGRSAPSGDIAISWPWRAAGLFAATAEKSSTTSTSNAASRADVPIAERIEQDAEAEQRVILFGTVNRLTRWRDALRDERFAEFNTVMPESAGPPRLSR